MSKQNNLTDFLTDVADAIREKKGSSDKINPQNFSEEIRSIESGSTEVEDAIVKRTVTSYSNTRITSVGTNAFRTCGQMKTIHIPSVHTLGTYCLGETGLINVVLPSVRTLGSQAFRSCTSLRSVHLEYDGQISILNQAFYMSTLTYLVIKSSYMATLGSNVFYSTNIANGTGYIYVPDNLVDDYKSATNWSAYADQIRPLSEYQPNNE